MALFWKIPRSQTCNNSKLCASIFCTCTLGLFSDTTSLQYQWVQCTYYILSANSCALYYKHKTLIIPSLFQSFDGYIFTVIINLVSTVQWNEYFDDLGEWNINSSTNIIVINSRSPWPINVVLYSVNVTLVCACVCVCVCVCVCTLTDLLTQSGRKASPFGWHSFKV